VGSQNGNTNLSRLVLLRFVGPTGNRKELLAKPECKALHSAQKRRGRVTQYFKALAEEILM
jgi:hypothetical protein